MPRLSPADSAAPAALPADPRKQATRGSVSENWQELGADWLSQAQQGAWRYANDAMVAAVLGRWLPPHTKHLLKTDLFEEAGGAGLTSLLAERARAIVGIDLSLAVASRAVTTDNVILVAQGDVRSLPFPDGCFDTVVSTSTLDHFATGEEIVEALGELARVTREGGLLAITLDNLANPLIALRNAIPHRLRLAIGLTPYFVGATLGPRGLRNLLAESGYEIEALTAVVHCPRYLFTALARLADRLGGAAPHAFARVARSFEWLSSLPSRFLTGHFLAALARKRSGMDT